MTHDKIPQNLISALVEGCVIPFVGAGVSRSVKRVDGSDAFPSWTGLLELAAKELERNARSQAGAVRAMLGLDEPNYLEAARHAVAGLGAGWAEFFEQVFDVAEADIDLRSLALCEAIWELGSELVITTNYDLMLRWAHPKPRGLKEWQIEAPAGQVAALRGTLSKPVVWHLHGSISDSVKIILAPDGYEALYGDDGERLEPMYKSALVTLRHLAATKTFLFIGFSLEDACVLRQLEWVFDTFKGCAGTHFVLAKKSHIPLMRKKIGNLDIRFIAFDDFGQPLLDLVHALRPNKSGSDGPGTAGGGSSPKISMAPGDPRQALIELFDQVPDLLARMSNPGTSYLDASALVASMLEDDLRTLTWRFRAAMEAVGQPELARLLMALYERLAPIVAGRDLGPVGDDGFHRLDLVEFEACEPYMAAASGRHELRMNPPVGKNSPVPNHAIVTEDIPEPGLELAERVAQVGERILARTTTIERLLARVSTHMDVEAAPDRSVEDQLRRINAELTADKFSPDDGSDYFTVVKNGGQAVMRAFAELLKHELPSLQIVFSKDAEASDAEHQLCVQIRRLYVAYYAIVQPAS